MFPGRFSSLNASVLWKSQYNLHWNADFFVSRKKTWRRERKKKIIHNLNSRQQTLILLFVLTFASVFSKVILTKNIPRSTVHYHKAKKMGEVCVKEVWPLGKICGRGRQRNLFFNQFWASAIEWEISRTWYLTRITYGQGFFGPSSKKSNFCMLFWAIYCPDLNKFPFCPRLCWPVLFYCYFFSSEN